MGSGCLFTTTTRVQPLQRPCCCCCLRQNCDDSCHHHPSVPRARERLPKPFTRSPLVRLTQPLIASCCVRTSPTRLYIPAKSWTQNYMDCQRASQTGDQSGAACDRLNYILFCAGLSDTRNDSPSRRALSRAIQSPACSRARISETTILAGPNASCSAKAPASLDGLLRARARIR